MTGLVVDITISLDGFVTAPNPSAEHPLGIGGDCLLAWIRDAASVGVDAEVLAEVRSGFGAYVMGRKTFDAVPLLGLEPVSGAPCFVVTHRAGDSSRRAAYVFVSQGIGHAFELASTASGDQPVGILGSASVVRQYLRAGLVDELRLHVVPVVLGSGVRLFVPTPDTGPIRLRRTGGIDSTFASHVKYRVVRS